VASIEVGHGSGIYGWELALILSLALSICVILLTSFGREAICYRVSQTNLHKNLKIIYDRNEIYCIVRLNKTSSQLNPRIIPN
jgi:hypothetical protein